MRAGTRREIRRLSMAVEPVVEGILTGVVGNVIRWVDRILCALRSWGLARLEGKGREGSGEGKGEKVWLGGGGGERGERVRARPYIMQTVCACLFMPTDSSSLPLNSKLSGRS